MLFGGQRVVFYTNPLNPQDVIYFTWSKTGKLMIVSEMNGRVTEQMLTDAQLNYLKVWLVMGPTP